MPRTLPFFQQLGRFLSGNPAAGLPDASGHRARQPGFRPMAVLRDERQAYKPPCACGPTAGACSSSGSSAHSTVVTTDDPSLPEFPHPGKLVLSGRMADVCAELERLVTQEEFFLRAG